MGHSTTKAAPDKAAVLKQARAYKAKKHLPLTVHPSSTWGRWCKKIRGRQHTFGAIVPGAKDFGSTAAIALYHKQKEDLEAGREPRVEVAGVTVGKLCSDFLERKDAAVAAGELSKFTRQAYGFTCDKLVAYFGKLRSIEGLRPDDFARFRAYLVKRGLGLESVATEVQRTRCVFKHAVDYKLVAAPVDFGPDFRRPPQRAMRLARRQNGQRSFSAEEVRLILDHADVKLRAMILLAVNTGIGNSDLGRLPVEAVDLQAGWLDFARGKTGVDRRCPLWPETVDAVREHLVSRPKPPKRVAHLVFLTPTGLSYFKPGGDNPLCVEFRKLVKRIDKARREAAEKAHQAAPEALWREGRGFYSLRHSFATAGDGARDPVALRYLMGHSPGRDITSVYLETPGDDRLRAVVDHVRRWVWPVDVDAGEENK
ncbi:MAG: tyrosine-type recombinase/integrase [Thermoguttaceae bacterium]|jgi:integrase|nr:tyrosine-type recombinase/integrase [Thermoguttaceae bacterium]